MRKIVGFSLMAVAAVALAGKAVSPLFQSYVSALKNAQSLSATFTSGAVDEAPDSFSIKFKKPNLARIESPSQVVVADGKQITTFDRSENTFYKRPQTDADLAGLLTSDEMNLWSAFFNVSPAPSSSRDMGTKNRKGAALDTVSATYGLKGEKTVTYFLGQQDKVVRQAQIDKVSLNGTKTSLVVTKDVGLNVDIPAQAFTFDAPAEAKEISLAQANAGKWFTDLNEAKKAARASGRKIFVDFMATWCGPCKLLEKNVFTTEKFKKLGLKMVFLRIDVDAQANIAEAYKIEAMPTQMLLSQDGSVLSMTVGYGGPEAFFEWINGALGSN
jgi:outer membrane lipoprotein-sorting protein